MEERNRIFDWIRQHVYAQIEQHEATYENGTIRDFIDIYIEAKQSDENKEIYTGRYLTQFSEPDWFLHLFSTQKD